MTNDPCKHNFAAQLSAFASSLGKLISLNGEWTIKGFVDVFQNVYAVSQDTKIVSKLLELHLFPHFESFAQKIGYKLELATHQNWYPDLSFLSLADPSVKFAVDLKTTYMDVRRPGFCNGFTLGSHGEYFTNRDSTKNIQYPYNQYKGHFCLGIVYSRAQLPDVLETRRYTMDEIVEIPSVIRDFTFFAVEKWRIASDKAGSGNTANIGSVKRLADILAGNGVFAKAGEAIFDDYWANYRKISIEVGDGSRKPVTSFDEYITYRGLSPEVKNMRTESED